MANVCKICNHMSRLEIDREICQGKNLSKIARDYDVSYDSVYSHSIKHMTRQLVKAMEHRELTEGINYLKIMEDSLSTTGIILKRNFEGKRDALALKAIDTQRNLFQLFANIKAQAHSMRMAELEFEKDKSGDNKEQQALEYAQKLSALTFDELKVFNRLQNKIIDQTNDEIITNNKVIGKNS